MPGMRALQRQLQRYEVSPLDLLIAAWFVGISLAMTATARGAEAGFRDADAVGHVLTLLMTVPLIVRRRLPAAVFLTMMFGGVVPHAAAGYPPNTAGLLATLVAYYTVVERCDFRPVIALTGIGAAGVVLFYAETRQPIDTPLTEAVDAVGAFGAAWLLGTFVRRRRLQAEADAAELSRLQRDREELARAAVADERTGIARELHDAVGHALNLVVIQAGAARRVIHVRPEQAAEALASIESAGRQALTDMDRMLGILRAEDDGPRGGPSTTSAPGLQHLGLLVERTREAGLPVELVVEGAPVPLPRTVDLSAYRIVQEALTNSLRHAGEAHATVRVRYLDDAVELEVTDDGLGASTDRNGGGGRGLIGMRERVRLFRGELDAGPQPGGGYRVRARLPLGDATS